MTPKQKAIIALELGEPEGLVPTLESGYHYFSSLLKGAGESIVEKAVQLLCFVPCARQCGFESQFRIG